MASGRGHEVQQTCFTAADPSFDAASVLVPPRTDLDAGRKLAPQESSASRTKLGEDQRCRSSTWWRLKPRSRCTSYGPRWAVTFSSSRSRFGGSDLSQAPTVRVRDPVRSSLKLLRDGRPSAGRSSHIYIGLPPMPARARAARRRLRRSFGPFICGRVGGVKRPDRVTRGVSLSNSTRLELARYLCSGALTSLGQSVSAEVAHNEGLRYGVR